MVGLISTALLGTGFGTNSWFRAKIETTFKADDWTIKFFNLNSASSVISLSAELNYGLFQVGQIFLFVRIPTQLTSISTSFFEFTK